MGAMVYTQLSLCANRLFGADIVWRACKAVAHSRVANCDVGVSDRRSRTSAAVFPAPAHRTPCKRPFSVPAPWCNCISSLQKGILTCFPLLCGKNVLTKWSRGLYSIRGSNICWGHRQQHP